MKPAGWALSPLLAVALGYLCLQGTGALGQQILQYGFESRDPVWVQGPADAPFKETTHKLTDETAHGGQRSEYLQVQADKGSFIHYTFDVGRGPVNEELHASLFIKANRPNVQLLCRVVLPREHDPKHIDQPMTTLIAGDSYQLVGRWQQLTVRQPVKRLKAQQQLLQAELKREVIVEDAYIDCLVLNVYGGPGQTDVWIDDLEVGPLEARPNPGQKPVRDVPARSAVNRRAAEVQLQGNQLLVSGKRFFLLGIRHTGTPLKTLRDAGFNTVWLDESAPPGLVEDAANLGFWIVPTITPPAAVAANPGGGPVEGQLTANEAFGRKVARFIDQDAVLFWDLGSNLSTEQYADVARTARAFRTADPMRPLAADVWDGYQRYSRGVEQLLLGIHRWPLMTTLEMPMYRDWLTGRRLLAQPGAFTWTWIQTHLPDWFTALAYDVPRTGAGSFSEPVGPQAEQIRLLAYTAVGSGYRGLGFWSDRFLADSHTGRDRLLALALLNQEFQMLEPLLTAAEEPRWIDTSVPQVKAAVLRSERAVLVLPVWVGPGSQFVPGQAAAYEISMVVPQVPGGAQPWEVSPGLVRSLPWTRVVGGTKVTLREFSLTAAIVFTGDLGPTGLVVRFQDQQRRMARTAAQWARDQAAEELDKVARVETELEKAGHRLPDGAPLMEKARAYLASSGTQMSNGNFAEAYADAQRTLRPLRILMRAQWEQAQRELDTPVASPYGVSFFTLMRHWRFLDEIRASRAGDNLLPDGDFESPPERAPAGWLMEELPSLDEVDCVARRVSEQPHAGKQCLMLKVTPKNPELPPMVLERTFLAIHSPAVRLPAGTKVRISAWVRVPFAIKASADGALLYDSAGGEPLAVRLTSPTPWKKITLYRYVPASGAINITLALTGTGAVYFDDVRIEPLLGGDVPVTAAKPR